MSLLALTACSGTLSGRATSIYDDPFRVAGLEVTRGPSGERPDVPDSTRTVLGTDGGEIDRVAANAIDDLERYWTTAFPAVFGAPLLPVAGVLSWDPSGPSGEPTFCLEATARLVNAGYCTLDHTIGWDRGVLLPEIVAKFGVPALVFVLAHEYGHAVQTIGGGVDRGPQETLVREQQADCYAGAFMRHVAEDHAQHFRLATADGLNDVLASTVAIGDTDPADPANVHGSAFERVTATQSGFTDGPAACPRIDAADIEDRRAGLPDLLTGTLDDGELPVTADTVRAFVDSLHPVFSLAEPPTLRVDGIERCAGREATGPVAYCPVTDTLSVDVPALALRGAQVPPGAGELFGRPSGDYDAYVLLAARYSQAVQHARRQEVDTPAAALRSACLAGVATAALGDPSSGDGVWLSPGDVDEAVAGLLTDGLAAADVGGRTVPSGFARVDAFRTGILTGEDGCGNRYG
ncbi:metallopeptidase [Rhodococcus rhodnii]|uniref:Metallopeptidase n=2 Tax=Rhodococcus rhodnii TaxID=38312 RepID=R7WSR7_9NOCA|nr:metallopeptidase [Rhodococcus rhodnii LMG 5362]TXG92811.1 metallopeptidase [Rhodococcus rhodnii]